MSLLLKLCWKQKLILIQKQTYEETALHWAAYDGHLPVLKLALFRLRSANHTQMTSKIKKTSFYIQLLRA